jgi:hypothetical protein
MLRNGYVMKSFRVKKGIIRGKGGIVSVGIPHVPIMNPPSFSARKPLLNSLHYKKHGFGGIKLR